jgi:Zn-dependent alcohol dehydrogenase
VTVGRELEHRPDTNRIDEPPGSTPVRAAVLRRAGEPLTIERLQLLPPEPGQVRVRVEAAGVCHSDYHYQSGDLVCPLPVVLGHEGAGVVEELGPGVSSVAVGDRVLFLWRTGCGRCEYCAVGRPALCSAGQQTRITGLLGGTTSHWRTDEGEQVYHFLGVSCLAEQTVCPEDSLFKIPPNAPATVAALAGCALMSGMGAVMNTAQVRPGASVLVLGCGGVGLSAVMGAVVSGARRIVAVDRSPERLSTAVSLGATNIIDSTEQDVSDALRELEPDGVDHVFEMIGNPVTIELGATLLKRSGELTLVGLSPLGSSARLNALDLVLGEKVVRGSMYGSSRPHADYNTLFQLIATGRLPVDRLPTRTFGLDEVNEAFQAMLNGRVGRAIIVPEPT